jgi:Tfp pilus assembly protein PilZ
MPTRSSEQTPAPGRRTDKGRANRAALDVPVCLRGVSSSFTGVAKNIGPGGVFVATLRLLGVGEKVMVMLDSDGDAPPVEALAEVRWCRPFVDLDDVPPGVGLQFIDTPVRAAILGNKLRRSRRGRAT